MTGPGFDPPDLEKRLAYSVKVNELLGRPTTPAEAVHLRLCFEAKWPPENCATALRFITHPAGEEPVAEQKAG